MDLAADVFGVSKSTVHKDVGKIVIPCRFQPKKAGCSVELTSGMMWMLWDILHVKSVNQRGIFINS